MNLASKILTGREFGTQLSLNIVRRSLRWMSSMKATYLLQQENNTNNERLRWFVQHSESIQLSLNMSNNILMPTRSGLFLYFVELFPHNIVWWSQWSIPGCFGEELIKENFIVNYLVDCSSCQLTWQGGSKDQQDIYQNINQIFPTGGTLRKCFHCSFMSVKFGVVACLVWTV